MAKPPTLSHSQGDTHPQAGAGREESGLICVKVKPEGQRLLGAAPSPALPSPFREDEARGNPKATRTFSTGRLHSVVPKSEHPPHCLSTARQEAPECPQDDQELSEATTDARLRGHLSYACENGTLVAEFGELLSENVSRVPPIFFKLPK